MPSTPSTCALVLAAILTTVSPVAAVVLAAAVLLWECFLFYQAGRE